jgi:hypothetical protein
MDIELQHKITLLSASMFSSNQSEFISLLNNIMTMPGVNAHDKNLISDICNVIYNNRNKYLEIYLPLMQHHNTRVVHYDTRVVERDITNTRTTRDTSRHTGAYTDTALSVVAGIATFQVTHRATYIVNLANYALQFVEGMLNYLHLYVKKNNM